MTRPLCFSTKSTNSPWLCRGMRNKASIDVIPRQSRGLLALLLWIAFCPAVYGQGEQSDDVLRAAARRSVAVATILDTEMDTPTKRLSAVFAMLDLEEIAVAGALLEPAIGADYNAETRAELVREFGTARFLNLARRDKPVSDDNPGPLAGAREFAKKCLDAAADEARDPSRIAKLVEQLNAPEPAIRSAARIDLSITGTAGGKAALEALAQETEPERRANIMQAILRLRPDVDPLLLAILAEGEGLLLRDAAEIAGHTGMLDAAPYLAAIAVRPDVDPTVQAAAQKALTSIGLSQADTYSARGLLVGEIKRLEAMEPLRQAGEKTWWVWQSQEQPEAGDAGPQRLTSHELSAAQIHTATLHRLARTLNKLNLNNPQHRQLEAMYFHELPDQLLGNLDLGLDTFSAEELSQGFKNAIAKDRVTSAVRFAAEMARRRDPAALRSTDAQRSPLADALEHPDRRVRFAALEAVMSIAPRQSFAGASAVPKALWEFAAAAGTPQAIAASSRSHQASNWAGQLRALGYDGIPVTTGRQVLQAALDSPRRALLVIDSDIGNPLLREVLYQLRGRRRTKQLPVAIFSSLHNLAESQKLAQRDPYLLAIARPQREGDFAAVVKDLEALNPAAANEQTRNEWATKSLKWIAELQANGHPYDELHRGADLVGSLVYQPELTSAALEALAALGTSGSQQSLLQLASSPSASLETRQAAVQAFADSVTRFGRVLTPSQVAKQYDIYNASETADRDTQKVLGQLLDILEDKPLSPASP